MVFLGSAKFYYWHLNDTERVEFIEAYNDGTMQFTDSEGFDIRPFFVAPADAE